MAKPGRKADIRKRAAEVFAQHGFDRASIRDVAKAADMSLAGLYYYYKGKEEILFDIQNEAFTTLLDAHAEALAGVKEPEQKLARVIDAHVTFFAQNIAEMKVMSRESEALEGEFEERVNALKRRYVRLVRGILEEMGIRPDASVFVLFGMMNWLYTWYDPERDGEPGDLARMITDIFLRGALPG